MKITKITQDKIQAEFNRCGLRPISIAGLMGRVSTLTEFSGKLLLMGLEALQLPDLFNFWPFNRHPLLTQYRIETLIVKVSTAQNELPQALKLVRDQKGYSYLSQHLAHFFAYSTPLAEARRILEADADKERQKALAESITKNNHTFKLIKEYYPDFYREYEAKILAYPYPKRLIYACNNLASSSLRNFTKPLFLSRLLEAIDPFEAASAINDEDLLHATTSGVDLCAVIIHPNPIGAAEALIALREVDKTGEFYKNNKALILSPLYKELWEKKMDYNPLHCAKVLIALHKKSPNLFSQIKKMMASAPIEYAPYIPLVLAQLYASISFFGRDLGKTSVLIRQLLHCVEIKNISVLFKLGYFGHLTESTLKAILANPPMLQSMNDFLDLYGSDEFSFAHSLRNYTGSIQYLEILMDTRVIVFFNAVTHRVYTEKAYISGCLGVDDIDDFLKTATGSHEEIVSGLLAKLKETIFEGEELTSPRFGVASTAAPIAAADSGRIEVVVHSPSPLEIETSRVAATIHLNLFSPQSEGVRRRKVDTGAGTGLGELRGLLSPQV